jgi:murein DD-endopeptidase MepM/ murein hydrolase activator NlpD
MRFSFFLIAGLLSLSACANAPWAPPSPEQANYAPPPSRAEPGERVQVQPGDTVYAVAKRYKVPMSDIIALNNLRSPFTLQPGSNVVIPAKQIMTVQPRPLQVPSMKEALGAPMPIVKEQAAPAAAPLMPVEKGVTLYHQEPTLQQRVDNGEKEVVNYQHNTREVMTSLSKDSAQHPVIVEAAVVKAQPVIAPPQLQKAELKPPVFKEVAGQGRFVWPVHGNTVSSFGPKQGGTRNDGINIAAPLGTPVAAADGGTVAYAGNDIPGYGNVVIIRHADGYLTTYAHLERIMVDKDSVAAKGDVIGTVGTSGGLASPQLHFEVRKGAEALDPSKYLGRT